MVAGQKVQFEAKDKNVTLPDTPAGRQMTDFLKAFNSGDADLNRRFIAEHFAKTALKQNSLEERAARQKSLFTLTQGLSLRRIEKSEDYAIIVFAQERLDETLMRVNIEVEKDAPHKIVGFGIRRYGLFDPTNGKTPEKRLSEAETLKDIRVYLDKLTTTDQFSGAVLIARNGKPIFTRAYGLANKSFNVPNRIDTKFNLASMNKMFTAVAIAQLAEAGKLSFDDTIIKHLPDYPNKAVAEKVTIHQLLTHTSGLGDFFNEKFEAKKNRLRAVSDYYSLFADDPLLFEPGAKWRYSNAGFIVLGAIIERVSGQKYFDYVREHIYKPAGMTNSDSYETDNIIENLAVGYTEIGLDNRAKPGQMWNNLVILPVKGSPAGGGYSTVEDLLKFDVALRENKLLSKKFTDLILTGKVETVAPDRKYAYGFMADLTNGTRIAGHGGTSPGANTKLDMYLDIGYTVIVLSNYDPRGAERVADRFRGRITRK